MINRKEFKEDVKNMLMNDKELFLFCNKLGSSKLQQIRYTKISSNEAKKQVLQSHTFQKENSKRY